MIWFINFICYHSDIDECQLGRDDCDENAECTNTLGSYVCTCKEGYSGDGTACIGKIATRP